jgi:type IV pilus assembly protein PilY1
MQFTARPKVFVFNLRTGEQVINGGLDLYSVDTSTEYSAVGDFLCADMDYPSGDYQSDDLYFGTYSTYSTDANVSKQYGGLYRLRIRNSSGYTMDPKNWVITRAVNISSGGLASADNRPVFGQPAVSIDDYQNIWVYFGTGIYVTKGDEIPTNEYMFGFKEAYACWAGSGSCQHNKFLDVTSVQYTGAQAAKIDCQCDGGITISSGICSPAGTGCPTCSSGGTAVVSRVSGATLTGVGACSGTNASEAAGIACMESDVLGSYDGWVRKFSYYPCDGCDDMGMKLYASIFVSGGIVSTTGFSPSTDPCSFGGKSHIIALNYTTGTSSYQPAVISAGGTSGSMTNLTLSTSVQFSSGVPPFKQSLVALGVGGGDGMVRYLTYFSQSFSVQPSVQYPNRFIQWITK